VYTPLIDVIAGSSVISRLLHVNLASAQASPFDLNMNTFTNKNNDAYNFIMIKSMN